MGSWSEDQYEYTADSARLYGSLSIEGTTYEIGFDAVRELLGDITGKTFLDFGCGAGRSTAFLRTLGAGQVYGVDHDRNMLEAARSQGIGEATFLLTTDAIPLPDGSVDGAISISVFVEIRTLRQMSRVCTQVARVLRPGSPFIVVSSSTMAFGRSFRSYRYPQAAESLRSGSRTPCIVVTSEGEIVIQDTYWAEDDYVYAVTHAGLTVISVDYPTTRDPTAWSTDEASVSPFLVIHSIKAMP